MRLNEMLLDGGIRLEDVQAEYNPAPTKAPDANDLATMRYQEMQKAVEAGKQVAPASVASFRQKEEADAALTPTERAIYSVDEQTKQAEKTAQATGATPAPAPKTSTQTKIDEARAKTAAAREKIAAAKEKIASAQTKIEAAKTSQAAADQASNAQLTDLINSLSQRITDLGGELSAVADRPTMVGQITRRKTGGTVQVVSLFSDGSEQVVDEYKDYSARDAVMAMFENTGLGKTFLDSLMATVDQVYADNVAPTDAQILNSIYNSDAYKTRFAANEIIRKRMADGKGQPGDRLLNPAEYVRTEDAYREIMSEAGLPPGFYDQPEDFTKFIAEYSTSVAEITERVNIAKSALQNADVNIKNALKDYYGLTESDMVAYLLDSERAFDVINSRLKYTTAQAREMYTSAEVGGAALRAGMTGIGRGFAEEITKAGKAPEAERAFQNVARTQEDYERLMSLAGREAGKEDLAREALGLAGGTEVALEARRLASKERARFAQRGAVDRTSLGRRLTTPDV